jgi:hypothetical protein
MKKRNSNLTIIDQQTAEEAERKQKRSEEEARWDKAEDAMRITREEARRRVRDLREELEGYRDQLEAVVFDIPNADGPMCLDPYDRKYTVNLVEDFDPRVKGLFDMIDEYARQHGCAEALDFNNKLLLLTMYTAESAFKIGVFARAIFVADSDREIDRLERGLVFSLASDRRIVDD